MKKRWLVRAFLVAMTLMVMPRATRAARLNFAALGFYHCDAREWASMRVTSEADSKVELLEVRLCSMPGNELISVEILLLNSDNGQNDPLLHYQLSRLYRSLSLQADADRELILAQTESASVIWNGLLAQIGLKH